MEYNFNYDSSTGVEILMVYDDEPFELEGVVTLRKDGDVVVVDTCNIVSKIKSLTKDGVYYEWYNINNHSTYVDRVEQIAKICQQIEQAITELDITLTNILNTFGNQEGENNGD